MVEAFETSGDWWLPSDPDRKASGILSLSDQGGLRLSIVSLLTGVSIDEPGVMETVCGYTEHHGPVTLAACHLVRRSWQEDGEGIKRERWEYSAEFAYLGANWPERQERRFNCIQFEIGNLHDWTGQNGFRLGREEAHVANDGIAYQLPEPISASMPVGDDKVEHVQLKFEFSDTQIFSLHSRILTETCVLRCETTQPHSFSWWLEEFAAPFTNFLSYAVQSPSHVDRVWVVLPADESDTLEKEVEVIVNQSVRTPAKENISEWDMYLPLSRIGSNLDEVLDRWIRIYIELDSVIQLYRFSNFQSDPGPYLEAKFLLEAQAVESFHYRRFPDEDNPQPEGKRKRRKIFQARVEELITATQLREHGLVTDSEAFARAVKDNRNYFTHYDPDLETKRLSVPELVDVIDILKVMLDVLILGELGWGASEAHDIIRSKVVARQLGTRYVVEGD